jgi:hypothetical protein
VVKKVASKTSISSKKTEYDNLGRKGRLNSDGEMEWEELPEIDIDETPCNWEIGGFVDMPMSLRLQYCEILIYMSDYE